MIRNISKIEKFFLLTTSSNNIFDTSSSNFSINKTEYNAWIFIDSLLLFLIIFGNILTILAIILNRNLRNVISNYFVLSLAISDLLVGLTLPYHIAFYIDNNLSTKKITCILRFVIISLACAGSVYNLVAISLDRYIAIVYPLKHSLYRTKKIVILITIMGWVYVINVAIVPFYWNIYEANYPCELENIFHKYYTLAIIMPSFTLVWLSLLLLYCKIYKEARMHVQRLRQCGFPVARADSKSIQVILLVLGCFSICWFPYLIVITIKTIGWYKDLTHTLYKATFSLAMANSGMNPIIYAWKHHNFRKAFKKLIYFESPNNDVNPSSKKYLRTQNILNKKKNNVQNGITNISSISQNYIFYTSEMLKTI